MVDQIRRTLEEKELELFVAEFSLEGVGEFHDRFRVSPGSFDRAMKSYGGAGGGAATGPPAADPRHVVRYRRQPRRDPATYNLLYSTAARGWSTTIWS